MNESPHFEQRLALLKAEVELDFPGLPQRLEAGRKLVSVMYESLCGKLGPECLRRFGGMTVLCAHYGAAVIFVKDVDAEIITKENLGA